MHSFLSKIYVLEFSTCCQQTYIVPSRHIPWMLISKNGVYKEDETGERREGEEERKRGGGEEKRKRS